MSTSQTFVKYRYRRRLPHLQRADAALFVTFCTAARVDLPAEARDLVLEHCLREHGRRVHLLAVIVMPDHVLRSDESLKKVRVHPAEPSEGRPGVQGAGPTGGYG